MVHCGICYLCIVGFMQQVYEVTLTDMDAMGMYQTETGTYAI